MTINRIVRTIAVLASASLIVGAFAAAPADAKKKKKKKSKKPAACAPFTPGVEEAAEKPTIVLTDEATEAAPVEQNVTLTESIGDVTLGLTDPSSDYINIQVDGAAPDAGLYALFEFPVRRDYDLNLLHTDGSYAARSRGFNTVIEANDQETPIGSVSVTGHGGEATDHSEKLVGIRTADCGGWTLQVQNWLGEGGEMPVKLWLGEATIDPQAPGAETP